MKSRKTVFAFTIAILLNISAFATDYYVNVKTGNDKNDGISARTAWKSLKKVSNKNFKPGDHILLATGQVFFGTIQLKNQYGKESKPIVISSYMVDNSNV